ncbi:MAG: EpsG family protein [Oscillospiraceae bacterium]|nr:EpsG family protein [Oscillospiraceae bacterium]
MILYYCITLWFFIILLLGLRPDSALAAESWPKLPSDKSARRNHLIVSGMAFAGFALLWFLTAFRSAEIGNDTKNYIAMFSRLFSQGISKKIRFEIGYQLLNIFIYKFTQSEHVFLIIMAAIMYAGIGFYIFHFSKNPAVSVCLFFACFFSVYTCLFRQGLAMIVALYGYQLLKSRRRVFAALVFLLATTFHLSAFVCFLLFLDLKILQNRLVVFGTTVLCAVVSRLGLFKVAVSLIAPKYYHYFTTQYASSGWLAITCYLVFYAGMYYLVSCSVSKDRRADRTVSANFAFLLILTAFGYAINLFDRVGEYFLLIAVSEFPTIMYEGKMKHYRLWVFVVCAAFLALFIFVLLFRPGWNHLYPYEFWH